MFDITKASSMIEYHKTVIATAEKELKDKECFIPRSFSHRTVKIHTAFIMQIWIMFPALVLN